MSSQVTRVMESDLHGVTIQIHVDQPSTDQFVYELGMVDNFIIPAESRVFVLDSMQTMRTGCHDARWVDFIQYLYICHCQFVE